MRKLGNYVKKSHNIQKNNFVLDALQAYIIQCRESAGNERALFCNIQDGVHCFSLDEGNHTSTTCDSPVQEQSETFIVLVYR